MKLLALMVVAALACEKGLKSFSAAVVSGYMGADAFVPTSSEAHKSKTPPYKASPTL
jgi:hypothetical protein